LRDRPLKKARLSRQVYHHKRHVPIGAGIGGIVNQTRRDLPNSDENP
jgi:hypothetical protein